MTSPFSPLNLPVRTASGQSLGQIVDVHIEPQTQGVIAYAIKPHRLVPNIVSSPLIIRREQVIELNDKEMVVDDLVMRTPAALPVAQPSA